MLGLLHRALIAAANRVERLSRRISQNCAAAPGAAGAHRENVIRTMSEYDMVTRPDEPYYARQYLSWIQPELERRFPGTAVRILDLGCGQGRLALPLAQWCSAAGGSLIGVDFTPAAVAKAREYAKERGIDNARFEQGDIPEFLSRQADATVDVVLMLEVSFVLPGYREALSRAARVLKPGGLIFASFRSQYYNALYAVQHRLWDGAQQAIEEREGHIFGSATWFTWQTPDDVKRVLVDSGFAVHHVYGIGTVSGIEGDPLSAITRPSDLAEADQERLFEIERSLAEPYAGCGRYIFAIAEKGEHPGKKSDQE